MFGKKFQIHQMIKQVKVVPQIVWTSTMRDPRNIATQREIMAAARKELRETEGEVVASRR